MIALISRRLVCEALALAVFASMVLLFTQQIVPLITN
jgi:hypothetical protein